MYGKKVLQEWVCGISHKTQGYLVKLWGSRVKTTKRKQLFCPQHVITLWSSSPQDVAEIRTITVLQKRCDGFLGAGSTGKYEINRPQLTRWLRSSPGCLWGRRAGGALCFPCHKNHKTQQLAACRQGALLADLFPDPLYQFSGVHFQTEQWNLKNVHGQEDISFETSSIRLSP